MSANNNHENGIFSRYGKWLSGLDRKQRRRLRLAQGALVLAVILLAAALALRAWIRVPDVPVVEPPASSQQGDVSQEDEGLTFDGAQLPEVAKSGRKEGHYTFLVAGRDVFSGATDTMLLFTFDTANKQLNAISLPRDTMINTNSASKRLNAVYGRSRGSSKLPAQERVTNGMTALKQEVSRLTGIYADFYVLVEWDAIGELVDALGGVEYNVPYDMHYDDDVQGLHIHQDKGLRVLNGDDAMQVIRWRKNNRADGGLQVGDDGRMAIQQDFLRAVLKECMDPATLLKIPSLAQVFLDNVNTDLTIGNLLAFAQLAIGMDLQSGIRFSTMPYTGVSYHKASMVVAVESKLLPLLNDGLNPYVDEITGKDLQLVYKKADGSFGVTNAAVADPNMEKVPVTADPKPEEPVQPSGDEPEEVPGESTGPDPEEVPSAGEQEGDLPVTIDPEQVFPDPEEFIEPPQTEEPPAQDIIQNDTAVLPQRPEPVDTAA